MIFLSFDFHYIGEKGVYERGIYPVSPKDLAYQLDCLSEHFVFIGQRQLIDAVEGRTQLPERSCLVTFDDGLRGQYENALPILQEKGIPAVYFVSSLPYLEKKACLVHKIHWSRAYLSEDAFYEAVRESLMDACGKKMENMMTEEDAKRAIAKYRYDNPREATLKFLLNNVLSSEEKEAVVDTIFRQLVDDENEFIEKFYLSENQIKHLYDLGYLGLHSYRHGSLAGLSEEMLRADICKNKAHLEGLVGGRVESISYPYGSKYDINSDVVRICKEAGVKLGFTKERACNTTLRDPLLLARADTNDVIGGKYPLFQMDGDTISASQGFSVGRSIWTNELENK